MIDRHTVSIHEAGHATAGKLLGMTLISITINVEDISQPNEAKASPSGSTLGDITFLVAGRMAEDLVLGNGIDAVDSLHRSAGDELSMNKVFLRDGVVALEARNAIKEEARRYAIDLLMKADDVDAFEKIVELLEEQGEVTDGQVEAILMEAGL